MPALRKTDQQSLSSVSGVNESMRRFSLIHRKSSSYASSSGDGSASSATQESSSSSSRLSGSESSRRRPSLASFGSRLKKSQSKNAEERLASSLAIRHHVKKRYFNKHSFAQDTELTLC